MSFVGIRGDSYLGDISIDEISVGELEECHFRIFPTVKDQITNPEEGEFILELYAVS